jgi:CBS domain-containing protein
VTQAIHNMLDNHVGAVCVVDNEGRVAGICTERDIMRRFALSGRDPSTTPVRDIMTTPVELATEQMTEAEALSIMLERHYRHLPIVDGDAHLLGMLSIRHLLEARVDELVKELDEIKAER